VGRVDRGADSSSRVAREKCRTAPVLLECLPGMPLLPRLVGRPSWLENKGNARPAGPRTPRPFLAASGGLFLPFRASGRAARAGQSCISPESLERVFL
jgi:hypothetical protein